VPKLKTQNERFDILTATGHIPKCPESCKFRRISSRSRFRFRSALLCYTATCDAAILRVPALLHMSLTPKIHERDNILWFIDRHCRWSLLYICNISRCACNINDPYSRPGRGVLLTWIQFVYRRNYRRNRCLFL